MSIRSGFMSFLMRHTIKKQFDNMGDTLEDVQAFRERMAASDKLGGKLPANVVTRSETINGVPCEWVNLPDSDDSQVLMYLHGGGYVFGGPDSHRDLAWRLAESAGCTVLMVDYRLAPEHPFPAAVDDAIQCYSWLLEKGYKSSQIAIGGDSAGGGLCAATLVNAKNLGFPQPQCAILLSPWLDLTGSGDSVEANAKDDVMLTPRALTTAAKHYLAERDRKAPLASPLFADLSGLPPILMHVSSTEILLSDSERFKRVYSEAGNEIQLDIWPKMPHVFQVLAGRIPEGKQAIQALGSFVKGHLNPPAAEPKTEAEPETKVETEQETKPEVKTEAGPDTNAEAEQKTESEQPNQ